MFHTFFRILLVAALCGLRVQPAQAEPVDSLAVEAEHHAATPQKREPQEITIYIRGEHKAMVAALVDAVDARTLVTGIADFDALSATYGLMGIDRKGRMSPFYYGNRFRLTFPPGVDVATVTTAYGNLSYIQSVEHKPPLETQAQNLVQPTPTLGNSLNDRAITRIPKKVGVGALTTVGVGLVFMVGGSTAGGGIGAWAGVLAAQFFGYPIGVYLADREGSSFWMTCVGQVAGWWWAIKLLEEESKNSYYEPSELRKWTALGAVLGAPVMASELSRLVPKRFHNPNPLRWLFGKSRRSNTRISFGLVPESHRGLSAIATLRF